MPFQRLRQPAESSLAKAERRYHTEMQFWSIPHTSACYAEGSRFFQL